MGAEASAAGGGPDGGAASDPQPPARSIQAQGATAGRTTLWIHALMDRKDKAAETYSSFYETYKKPFDEIDDEDPRVAEARYEQAMCYYDRQPLGEEDAALAHKYFTYFLDRYDGTGKADPEKIKKAADFRAQILMDFYQAAKWFWAAEGSANYEP